MSGNNHRENSLGHELLNTRGNMNLIKQVSNNNLLCCIEFRLVFASVASQVPTLLSDLSPLVRSSLSSQAKGSSTYREDVSRSLELAQNKQVIPIGPHGHTGQSTWWTPPNISSMWLSWIECWRMHGMCKLWTTRNLLIVIEFRNNFQLLEVLRWQIQFLGI